MNAYKKIYKIAAVVAVTILIAFGFSLIMIDLLLPPHCISWHGTSRQGLSIAAWGLFLGWFSTQLQKFFKDQAK